MKEKKLERKLRKRAVKLARFAKRNGIDYLGIGAYVKVAPAAYITCERGGRQYYIDVPLDGEADA